MGQQGITNFQYPQLSYFQPPPPINLNYDPLAVNEFDKKFEEQEIQNNQKANERLNKLDKTFTEPKPYQLSIYGILVGIKDTWFYLFDDLLREQFYLETFTKDNRLFYIGLTIVLIIILIFLFNLMFGGYDNSVNDNSTNQKVVEIHHIYHDNQIPTTLGTT
jgi:hypothetical protein